MIYSKDVVEIIELPGSSGGIIAERGCCRRFLRPARLTHLTPSGENAPAKAFSDEGNLLSAECRRQVSSCRSAPGLFLFVRRFEEWGKMEISAQKILNKISISRLKNDSWGSLTFRQRVFRRIRISGENSPGSKGLNEENVGSPAPRVKERDVRCRK